MSKLIQLTKSGVTVIKPEMKVAEFKKRGFIVDGEIDPETKRLKVVPNSANLTPPKKAE